ncbi:MAG: glycosyltransferase family 4 protein, partial [Bdellovibrionota bacterium]
IKMSLSVRFIHSLYMSAPSKKDFLHRLIYSKIDAITSSSEILNERIKKNYPVPESKVHLLRYGRDQNDFEKNSQESLFIRQILNAKKNDFVFATMCRLDSAKGVREIAESLLHLSQVVKEQIKIWIMGEPTLLYTNEFGNPVYEEQSLELYEWLKNFVEQNKNSIELIPFQKNIQPFLDAMDVFILATYKETYSLSVLDAMCAGIPVIGTNSGGTPEQVKNLERGFLVEPKSAKSIAEAITYYVENKIMIQEHGQAAKLWVRQEHDWNKTILQLKKLYST